MAAARSTSPASGASIRRPPRVGWLLHRFPRPRGRSGSPGSDGSRGWGRRLLQDAAARMRPRGPGIGTGRPVSQASISAFTVSGASCCTQWEMPGRVPEHEIRNELPGALQQLPAEGEVVLAPDHQRRDLDPLPQRGDRVGRRARPGQGPVVVDHRGHRPGAHRSVAVDAQDVGREAGALGRGRGDRLGGQPAAAGGEQPFGKPRHLERGDVPRAQPLPPAGEPVEQAGGMRHVEDDQPLDAPRMPEGGVPGDGAAPVVADQHRPSYPGGVDEARDVVDQVGQRIVLHGGRARRPAVTAKVRRPGPVAEPGEQRELVAPREGQLREAVQAEGQTPAGPARVDLEGQPVGRHLACLDAATHGRVAREAAGRLPMGCSRTR